MQFLTKIPVMLFDENDESGAATNDLELEGELDSWADSEDAVSDDEGTQTEATETSASDNEGTDTANADESAKSDANETESEDETRQDPEVETEGNSVDSEQSETTAQPFDYQSAYKNSSKEALRLKAEREKLAEEKAQLQAKYDALRAGNQSTDTKTQQAGTDKAADVNVSEIDDLSTLLTQDEIDEIELLRYNENDTVANLKLTTLVNQRLGEMQAERQQAEQQERAAVEAKSFNESLVDQRARQLILQHAKANNFDEKLIKAYSDENYVPELDELRQAGLDKQLYNELQAVNRLQPSESGKYSLDDYEFVARALGYEADIEKTRLSTIKQTVEAIKDEGKSGTVEMVPGKSSKSELNVEFTGNEDVTEAFKKASHPSYASALEDELDSGEFLG